MIVITTPTRQIGHQVLENVLDRSEPIRVIARDPARLTVAFIVRVGRKSQPGGAASLPEVP